MTGSGTDQSGCPTEAYSDGNHNSHALSRDVYRHFATLGTMSLPLTPLVTDIQWPRWLKTKWYHTAYVVTANTSFAFTIYGMKWDLRPLGILPRGVLVEVYYL